MWDTDMTAPDSKGDLQPLGGQGTNRLVMTMTSVALLSVVGRSPCAVPQAGKSKQVQGMAEPLVTGEAELDQIVFAAALGDRHGTLLRLEVRKDSQRPRASPSSAHTIGTTTPLPALYANGVL